MANDYVIGTDVYCVVCTVHARVNTEHCHVRHTSNCKQSIQAQRKTWRIRHLVQPAHWLRSANRIDSWNANVPLRSWQPIWSSSKCWKNHVQSAYLTSRQLQSQPERLTFWHLSADGIDCIIPHYFNTIRIAAHMIATTHSIFQSTIFRRSGESCFNTVGSARRWATIVLLPQYGDCTCAV